MSVIKVHGPIGSYKNEKGVMIKGVELVDVIAQVESTTDDHLVFDINSIGGLVSVGYSIRDYMNELRKQGKIVDTLGNGVVESIATVIFLAGTKRQIVKGTDFIVHNPYAQVQGDADTLKEYAKGLQEAEADMAKYYSSITGVSAIAMDLLMKEDKPMSTEKAVQLKFATEEIDGTLNVEFKNMAIIAAINIREMTTTKSTGSELLKMVTAMYNKLSGNTKNLSVTTDDGRSLEVEGDTITVGALVTLDGSPTPSATYKLVDGSSFTTDAEGKITEITEAPEVEAKMGDVVKDNEGKIIENGESVLANGMKVKTNEKGEIISMEAGESTEDSSLEKENKQLKARLEEMEKTQGETTDTVEKLAKLMGSNYTPPAKNTVFGKSNEKNDKKGDIVTADSVREQREKRKALKKG